MSKNSTVLTTLHTLSEMARRYLRYELKGWEPEHGLIPRRPSDAELERGSALFSELWDHIAALPSLRLIDQGKDPGELRRFTTETPPGAGHMLFRPIGQIALAQALGILHFSDGHDLDVLFKKLERFDRDGRFAMESPDSLWYMVLYDPNKKRVMVRGRDLAVRLLQYLLGGGISDDAIREKLRSDLAHERRIGDKWVGIGPDQPWVRPEEIELPPAL